jgi:hypothetical protein
MRIGGQAHQCALQGKIENDDVNTVVEQNQLRRCMKSDTGIVAAFISHDRLLKDGYLP